MATATPSLPPQTTPVFTPDGATIVRIPDQDLPDAMAHGGKLAVQMKTPDGTLHFVPHDQVGEAQKAGGVVNTEQGPPDDPRPKEGFWHSVGAVFGLTKEQIQASAAARAKDILARGGGKPTLSGVLGNALDTFQQADPAHVAVGMVKNAAQTAPGLIKKAYGEAEASNEAISHGDIVSFLAHEIGGVGYTGAAVASPVLGNAPAKAGEQFGEGNIKGGLGTATGILAPIVAGGAIKGKAPAVEAPNVFEGEPPASIPAGKPVAQPGIMNRVATTVANAKLPPGADLIPKVTGARAFAAYIAKKTAPGAVKEIPVYGGAANAEARGPYQPYQGDLTVTPEGAREVIPSEREAVAPAQPPKTSQVLKDAGVTQAMKEAGIAAPSASARGVRPGVTAQLAPRADIQFPPGLNGEDASLMQLTRYNINELRFMANKRGLPVSPKDTHAALIEKIHGSLTPEETAGFQAAAQASKVEPSKFPENNLMADNLNEAASALQQAKGSPYEIASLRNAAGTIRQYPKTLSEIDLAGTKIKGIDKRIGARIQDFLQQQKAVSGADDTVQTTAGEPMTILEAMRRSLQARGIKPPY